jgi:hypothetical protein
MSTRPIPDSIGEFPVIYPPRFAFSYVIVREPNNVHVLFKAFSDNNGTVRLCEFASRAGVEEFLADLPPARRVWL